MLSKKFKGNKIYEVTRYIFKYGNEEDEMENTVTVWDSLEKAKAYIERYATGLKWAGAQIEVINLDREITVEDYKSGNYNVVSFQKIYDVTLDWIEDETPEEVIVLDKEEYTETYQVSRFGCCPMDKSFKTLDEAKKYAEKYAERDKVPYIVSIGKGSTAYEIERIEPKIEPASEQPDVKEYVIKNISVGKTIAKVFTCTEKEVIEYAENMAERTGYGYMIREIIGGDMRNKKIVKFINYPGQWTITDGEYREVFTSKNEAVETAKKLANENQKEYSVLECQWEENGNKAFDVLIATVKPKPGNKTA